MKTNEPIHEDRSGGMTEVMHRNIRTVLERRRSEDRQKSLQLRMADVVTRFTGSMLFVYIHLVLFSTWIIVNLPAVPLPKFDPSFVTLAMFASVEAIFLSTFVLISQNRMAAQADQRADLDLQVSLLAEHEVTRLITLVKQIAERLEIDTSQHHGLEELEQDVAPESVLDAIEAHQNEVDRTER
ncbi:MAG TPA: DUF1003 domain-containing protein [Chthoniobacteraceae bacterium]